MNAVAAQWSVKVDTARGSSINQAGSEAKVVGTVFSLAKDAVSAPIIGNNGVYIVSPIADKTQVTVPADLTMARRQFSSTSANAVRINLMNSLKKASKVKDNRSRFF